MRLAAASVLLLFAGCSGQEAPPAAAPAIESPSPSVIAVGPQTTLSAPPVPTRTPADRADCTRGVAPFVPTGISITGLALEVLALPRDARNVPGVPPVAAKYDVAWDAPGVRPGERRGNVLLNTHTWPDGSALGNRLLAQLHEGDRFELVDGAGGRLCYEVTERLEVSVDNPPLHRVYDEDGPPQAVIIVCSGTRLGPGEWTHRTLWFASPS